MGTVECVQVKCQGRPSSLVAILSSPSCVLALYGLTVLFPFQSPAPSRSGNRAGPGNQGHGVSHPSRCTDRSNQLRQRIGHNERAVSSPTTAWSHPYIASRQDASTEHKQPPCRGSPPPSCPGGTGYEAAVRGS